MSGHMGNPGPIGLMAFAVCIFMLGTLNAGLIGSHFKELLTTFGFWWGGFGQVAVGLLELLHGNSFGALIFWTYGSLWLALSSVWFLAKQNEYQMKAANGWTNHSPHKAEFVFGFVGAHHYKDGETLMLLSFAVITAFLFVVSLRKNRCLQLILFLLFWSLLLGGIGENDIELCKTIGGWFGMATGCVVFYTMAAEIVNEEWGYSLMPGIAPMLNPKSSDDFEGIFQYDKKQKGVFLNLSGLHFLSSTMVEKFEEVMEAKFSACKKEGERVHVVVNYKGVEIAPDVQVGYSLAVQRLQAKHYLSVRRFEASAFRDVDTGTGAAPTLKYSDDQTSPMKVMGIA